MIINVYTAPPGGQWRLTIIERGDIDVCNWVLWLVPILSAAQVVEVGGLEYKAHFTSVCNKFKVCLDHL